MTRPLVLLAAAALVAAAPARAADTPAAGAPEIGRYAVAVLPGPAGGAFVTDSVTGETMFCTPRECRRLPVRGARAAPARAPSAAPAPPRLSTVDEILGAAPPDPPPPPNPGVAGGQVAPAFRNF